MKIDLNCDLGESFGAYTIGRDADVLPLITSASIACGWHAGDPVIMEKTVRLAKENGISAGAHPGFPDLMGFGRRNMTLSAAETRAYILYQLGALDAFCKAAGTPLHHVKPHGALYNMAAKDPSLAAAVCDAVKSYNPNLIILAQESGHLYKEAVKAGLPAAAEVFADRAYEEDGSLVSRSKPGSMITDPEEALQRVLGMVKDHKVTAITGKTIELKADSVCIHGDNEHAVEFAAKIRKTLADNGIEITPLYNII